MTVVLDTATVPARDRIDALHAAYRAERPPRTVRVDVHPVHHRVERLSLGPDVTLLRTAGSPLQIARTERQVRGEAPEHLAIGLRRRGRGDLVTGGSGVDLPVGQLNCVDMTRAYRLSHRTEHDHDVLVLANGVVGVSVDLVRAAAPALARSPVYELVRGHVAGLHRAGARLAPEHRALTGQATVALVRALLTTAARSDLGRDAMADSLATRVALYIEAHLSDRDLTVATVAAAHAVSVRHLYDVWARSGRAEPPARWIVDRRLHCARDLLAGPGRPDIGAVARRAGFGDASHFSRRFRSAFGLSPSDWRAAYHDQPGRDRHGPPSA